MNRCLWTEKFTPAQKGITLEEYQGRKDNIVVIAPHPDDDVLGAGGTMAQASSQGKGVFSVYVTDGRGSPRMEQDISDDEMAEWRGKEAMSALQAVGAVGGFSLKKQSRDLEGDRGGQTERELVEIFRLLCPEEVLLPAPYERHLTHQRCTRLGIRALRNAGAPKTVLLGYSLWGSFWGGHKRIVRDITPCIKKKVEAVVAHASQVTYKNYQQGILGRNNSEAIFWEIQKNQKATFVEIFLDMSELLEKPDLTLENFIRQDFEIFLQTFLIKE